MPWWVSFLIPGQSRPRSTTILKFWKVPAKVFRIQVFEAERLHGMWPPVTKRSGRPGMLVSPACKSAIRFSLIPLVEAIMKAAEFLKNLEQSRSTHPAANAHGDDHMLYAAPLALDQRMSHHPGA